MAAVLFQQSQPALFEFAFPFLRRRGSCSSGAFLLDHHHVQLTFQQVDFSLRQFLTSKVIESCWQHYFDREQKKNANLFSFLQMFFVKLLLEHSLTQFLLATT